MKDTMLEPEVYQHITARWGWVRGLHPLHKDNESAILDRHPDILEARVKAVQEAQAMDLRDE